MATTNLSMITCTTPCFSMMPHAWCMPRPTTCVLLDLAYSCAVGQRNKLHNPNNGIMQMSALLHIA